MFYQQETDEDRAFNKKYRADRSKTESKRREVQLKVDQGAKELTREDFNVLMPVDKLQFGRSGGGIVG